VYVRGSPFQARVIFTLKFKKVLPSWLGSRFYPESIHTAGIVCQGQHYSLFDPFVSCEENALGKKSLQPLYVISVFQYGCKIWFILFSIKTLTCLWLKIACLHSRQSQICSKQFFAECVFKNFFLPFFLSLFLCQRLRLDLNPHPWWDGASVLPLCYCRFYHCYINAVK
jgi:hypothetical protein